MPDPLPAVTVSIQLRFEHVTAGLLGDHDLVLVPAPPPDLLDPAHELDVVTIPDRLAEGHPVERLRVESANLLWMDGERERPVAAVLKVARSSIYAPTMRPFHGGELASALERTGGDVWAALEELGTVDSGLRSGPGADVLGRLPDIERQQRLAGYRNHQYSTPADIGWSICRWLLVCQPD